MNEQDVRALVREAIERHLGRPERSATAEHYDRPALDTAWPVRSADLQVGQHASHVLLKVAPGSEVDEGMCVIEPRVRCNHCGFCQSYGH